MDFFLYMVRTTNDYIEQGYSYNGLMTFNFRLAFGSFFCSVSDKLAFGELTIIKVIRFRTDASCGFSADVVGMSGGTWDLD
jgi:hypothetical protein